MKLRFIIRCVAC